MANFPVNTQYKEPEYKVRPTWGLAWGLLWRMWVLLLPLYALIAFLNLGK
jgi:hypothetical protein